MKTVMKKLISYVAVALALTACTFDEWRDGPPGRGMAEISLIARMPAAMTAGTRGETGTAAENAVTDIHILLFEIDGGKLVHMEKGKDLSVADGAQNDKSIIFNATLPVGKEYEAMVLANAANDLQGISPGAVKADVQALMRELSVGERWELSTTPIPMWDEKVVTLTARGTPVFHLTRMLARVNVEYVENAPPFRLTCVRVYNYNTAGVIVPDAVHNMAGSGAGRHATAPTLPFNSTTRLGEALEYTVTDNRTCLNEIYLFEAAHRGKYSDGNDAWTGNPCLVVGGKYDSDRDGNFDEEPTGWYRIDFIRGNTWAPILRNYSYNITITSVGGPGYGDPDTALRSAPVNIAAEVLMWNDAEIGNVIVDGQYMLGVGRNPVELPATSHGAAGRDNILKIVTDHPGGWHASVWGDKACTLPSAWLSTGPGDASGAGGGTPDEVRLLAPANDTESDRTAWIRIEAGRLRYVVGVVQKKREEVRRPDIIIGSDYISTQYLTYVGAFWRAGQTGERIIRIEAGADPAAVGKWSAAVVWMDGRWGPDDGVVLAAATLPELQAANPHIYTAAPGDAENYPMTGITDTYTGGTVTTDPEGRYITFRIGLKTAYTPTAEFPARYAIVQLTIGGSKAQRIFLRQGEGADYLMSPADPVHSSGLDSPTRSAARQFSPCNLTAAALNAKVSLPNPVGTAFTDYPTQAGAMFQWASFYTAQQRVAWDPCRQLPQGVAWRADGTGGGYWNHYEAFQETCPDGYRRPNDGPVNTDWPATGISGSEVRQSLWYEPVQGGFISGNTNFMWGCYADGYFDRRPMEKVRNTDRFATVVAKGTSGAAYAGGLFYNPSFGGGRYNASIFFPAAGGRQAVNGALSWAGSDACYWTSSTQQSSASYSWSYNINPANGARHINANRSIAYPIRCVVR